MKLIFATQNSHKIEEARGILGESVEILVPASLGLTEEVEETGETLEENSLIKARFVKERLGGDCFADDSGLETEILSGAPGVYSARYGGASHDFDANIKQLLTNMAKRRTEAGMAASVGLKPVHATSKARFRTVVTLILGEEIHTFEGELRGVISLSRSGNGGFGYDPVFIPDEIPVGGKLVPNESRVTLAQLPAENKNAISHRGKALRAMAEFLLGK